MANRYIQAEPTSTDVGINNDVLWIHGGLALEGVVDCGGFKHSLVTAVAAACAATAPVTLTNCPDLVETDVLASLVRALGGKATRTASTLILDATDLGPGELDTTAAGRIHGSIYLLPALLARFGRADLPPSGGCQIGDLIDGQRPVEHYLDVFERFGAHTERDAAGGVVVSVDEFSGCDIDLLDYTSNRRLQSGPLYSGASKMALLCASVARGPSRLSNLYPKPDVADLVDLLRRLGADIQQLTKGSCLIYGRGPEALTQSVEHELITDLVELMTWACAGALLATRPLIIRGQRMEDAWAALRPESEVLERMGVDVEVSQDSLAVSPAETLEPCEVVVSSPGVFSDSHPFLALLATHGGGRSTITETVWRRRFGYVDGLSSLGARLDVDGARLTIDAPCRPSIAGQGLAAPDLRSAAVLLLAALMVDGETTLSGAHHLDRGYGDLAGTMRSLGARVETMPVDEL